MRLPFRSSRFVLTAALVATALAACTHDDPRAARAVEETVRRSIEAENAGDARTFLTLWTDDGLRSYDAGSRRDIESGKAPLGAEKTEVRGFAGTKVKGGEAETVLDGRVEIGLYRMRFDLVRRDGRWLLDGFRFLGPTPPARGVPVVPVKAVEYGYDVDRAALATGDVAIEFSNAGVEQHEISVVSLPQGTTVAETILALRSLNDADTPGLPPGIGMVGHLAYNQPGQTMTYTLADRLVPGRYALVCFLPVGGVTDFGTAKVPGAETHVARGMLADFTVG